MCISPDAILVINIECCSSKTHEDSVKALAIMTAISLHIGGK